MHLLLHRKWGIKKAKSDQPLAARIIFFVSSNKDIEISR